MRRVRIVGVWALVGLLGAGVAVPRAHADTVLSFKYIPAPRLQVAIWIEDANGRYLATVALTDAVAYRGIGNRPGASEMNSGYRWPYGRREGVLPIWAHRRASAPGARLFERVIFQKRVEGRASQTASDQSSDRYYCLQFDESKSTRDKLDAVSCASAFNSDKGRYLTQSDVTAGYAEPWEDHAVAVSGILPMGRDQALPLGSVYPPRMDITPCASGQTCFDQPEVLRYAEDARAVMPEIDEVTMATPAGDIAHDVLFTVPKTWPAGEYVAWIEVNLEGDYNQAWNATTYPMPRTPTDDWDSYAKTYGYPYRGQPSLAWKVAFTLGADTGKSFSTEAPVGRSSWDCWSPNYGALEPLSFDAADASCITNNQSGSGIDRLHRDDDGQRFVVQGRTVTAPPDKPKLHDAGTDPVVQPDAGALDASVEMPVSSVSDAAFPTQSNDDAAASDAVSDIGPVLDLMLSRHPNRLRTHTWVMMRLRAVQSAQPLHDYEVRVATEPISDESTFIRAGRQAKNATDNSEGATLLSLPTDSAAGTLIEATIGDLVAETHYYVAVRATDQLNMHGPISVAQITTTKREFATVAPSPCFVATAAYGSPLNAEIGTLRHVRDRYLLPNTLGRAWVGAYYAFGARLASWLAPRPSARAAVRALLAPLVAVARRLP